MLRAGRFRAQRFGDSRYVLDRVHRVRRACEVNGLRCRRLRAEERQWIFPRRKQHRQIVARRTDQHRH